MGSLAGGIEILRHPMMDPRLSFSTWCGAIGMGVLGLLSFGLIPALSARGDHDAHASQVGFVLSCVFIVGLLGWGVIEAYDAWQWWRGKDERIAMGLGEEWVSLVRRDEEGDSSKSTPSRGSVELNETAAVL